MSMTELFLVAVGLSMDAFAVAICKGLAMHKASLKNMLIVGLYFGVFQAVMPLIGFLCGMQFADYITAYDHWIAFVLLGFIGIQMIRESRESGDEGACAGTSMPSRGASPNRDDKVTACAVCDASEADLDLSPQAMLPLAVATSIDALAVGISFAFLRVDILPAASFIGVVTLVLSAIGVKLGRVFGARFKSGAEAAGGGILILIGLKILLEHTGFLTF